MKSAPNVEIISLLNLMDLIKKDQEEQSPIYLLTWPRDESLSQKKPKFVNVFLICVLLYSSFIVCVCFLPVDFHDSTKPHVFPRPAITKN